MSVQIEDIHELEGLGETTRLSVNNPVHTIIRNFKIYFFGTVSGIQLTIDQKRLLALEAIEARSELINLGISPSNPFLVKAVEIYNQWAS